MDLREQLERAIPHGRTPLPAQERVTAGRVALRRRRTAVAAGAVAVVVAVAVPVAVAAGGPAGRGTDLQPAVPPTTATSSPPSDGPARQRTPSAAPWPAGEPPARLDLDTQSIVIRNGAVVHERRRDLFPGKATQSVALDLTFRGERYWVALEWDESGGSETDSGPDGGRFATFDEFVAGVVATGGMGSGSGYTSRLETDRDEEWPTPGHVTGLTVTDQRFASDGTVTILEQQPAPDLPDNFAPPEAQSAAAYVEQDGTRYLVLWRDTGGPPQLIAVESAGHGESLAALLVWARQRYESGAGLL